jgi:hypothetical protein
MSAGEEVLVKGTEDSYQPGPEHKFTFGLWTVGNRGRDPFGDAVRPLMSPVELVALLAEVGAWGVNLHDDDLVPIDATPSERQRIVCEFKKACKQNGLVVPMATVSLFFHPSSGTALSPRTIPKCEPMGCKRPCAPWIWERNSAPESLCCRAEGKEWRPMPAAARMKP